MDKLELKRKVIEKALEQVKSTLKGIEETAKMKMSAGASSGSSVTQGSFGSGDTGIEDMSKEVAAMNMKEAEHLKKVIDTFENYKFEQEHEKAGPLAMVVTNKGNFFITYAVNNVKINGETYFMLATNAPIYNEMKGKKKGDKFSFNGNTFEIKDVF